MKKPKSIKNIVVISDTHFGSTLALCPPGVRLDDGARIERSVVQQKLWQHWTDFWGWVDNRLGGEPFILVHNGDIVDGSHHKTTTVHTDNPIIQQRLAVSAMKPIVDKCYKYFQIRGTEAHVGQSACLEESVAEILGAEQEQSTGAYSRQDLWLNFGDELLNFCHHIGTTSSSAYESSAVQREIVAAFTDAGQWKKRPPSIVIRSHRHRYIEVKNHGGRGIVTPAWQAKTPFVFKIDRLRLPMFGGLILRQGEEVVLVREWIRTIEPSATITV
jgi:hypothetical protein